jgi:hypothetical protein
MPNSTAEYTDVDGTSLQTLVQNLRTWGGSREGVPPLRGEDQKIPYMPGRRFVRKVPDSRTITLEGWLNGADPATGKGSVRVAKNNWKALRKLLWTPDRTVALTKRWYDVNGTLWTATAQAQFAGGLEPDVNGGGTSLRFEVDMFLPDPFFYSSEITETLARGTAWIGLLGDWATLRSRIELVGSQGPTTIAVAGTFPHSVTYSAAVATGKTVTLDIANFKATDSDGNKKTVNVSHSGSRFWMYPPVVPVQVTLSGTGTGVARYVYSPAWL